MVIECSIPATTPDLTTITANETLQCARTYRSGEGYQRRAVHKGTTGEKYPKRCLQRDLEPAKALTRNLEAIIS